MTGVCPSTNLIVSLFLFFIIFFNFIFFPITQLSLRQYKKPKNFFGFGASKRRSLEEGGGEKKKNQNFIILEKRDKKSRKGRKQAITELAPSSLDHSLSSDVECSNK